MGVFTKKLRVRFQDVDGKWHNPIVPLGRKGISRSPLLAPACTTALRSSPGRARKY
jgi:hypothetical protein